MRQEGLGTGVRRGALLAALLMVLAGNAGAQAKPAYGKLVGVVRDASGTPQLGAAVQVLSEVSSVSKPSDLITNTQGIFHQDRLIPGLYTIRVTLAGFLPTLQQHVRVSSNLTTVLRIDLESMFASLDQLRRRPSSPSDGDEWKWVLRSSVAMRPVLQWLSDDESDAEALATDDRAAFGPARGRLEFTSGARRPGSITNQADAAGTAFAYDQKVGAIGRLFLASQASYERSPAAGFATIWLPAGSFDSGPQTTVVLRESKLGNNGRTFQGVRLDQSGRIGIGRRVTLRYGAEYINASFDGSASSLRPRAEMEIGVDDRWSAILVFAAQGGAPAFPDPEDDPRGLALASALNQLDAFPALLWRDGHPVFESGWHEEVAARRKLGSRGTLQLAAFRDDSDHTAVYATGADPGVSGFVGDFFSHAFVTDGGSFRSWGARAVLQEKVTENIDVTAVYAYAGALSLLGEPGFAPMDDFRDALHGVQRQSFATNIKARIPRSGTRIAAGYKWINGSALSSVDGYGESLYQDAPYLSLGVRQALPKIGAGRWEALAECQNLLAQGYVPVNGRDGTVWLVPAFRIFRGGLSFQF